ncbi:glycosyltransferase family 4 protein [Candidatus Parvarchaeota archaeon]|jgi:glycosyltransferase involved in cell wall biosynthesis|nr:glycosyltransferase family 4 protein [Candidatus Parvarchaeota archaeon]
MVSNDKIKMAIFVPWIKSKGGVERAILKVLEDKKYKSDIFTFFYDKKNTFDDFEKYNVKLLGNAEPKGFIGRGANLFKSLMLTKIPNLDNYDIFMISTAGIAELITFRNRHKKTVAMCHTPLRVAHTMYKYYKKQSFKNRFSLPLIILFYKLLEKSAWKRINYALVFSNEVKERLVNYGLMDSGRIFNLGPHVNYLKIKKADKIEKIIFYPSRFIRYKRQDLAIKAFNLSNMPKNGFKLVLGGFAEDRKYFESLKKLETKNIIVKENLSEKELTELYRKSYATLFLAINEDTGLTPLESLAYGKPVISVNEGGPKEFIKDEENGLLVNADEMSIADALNKILNKKFYAKLRKGAERSTRYDEKRFMKNLENAISSILGKTYK